MTISRHVGLIMLAAMSQAFASGDPHAAPAPAQAPAAKPPAHAAVPAPAAAGVKPAPAAHAPVTEKKPEELAPSIRPLTKAIHPPRQVIHAATPYSKPAAHKKTAKPKAAHVPADEASRAMDAAIALLVKMSGKHGAGHGEAMAAILSCDDTARNRLLERSNRAYYVVQNPGNQLMNGDAALTYAVRQLNVPVLLIMARPGCKAVDMARSDYSRAPAELQRQLSSLYVDKDVSNNEAQLQNLDNQVEAAMLSFGGEIESGRLAVIGTYYDVGGALGQGRGRLVVANLNGEKERKEISRLLARHNLSNAATGMTAPLTMSAHTAGKPAADGH